MPAAPRIQAPRKRPAMITPDEIRMKLAHLRDVLAAEKKTGILLAAEGAMRWLTGMRHQIIDITPDGDSPVQALLLCSGSGTEITFLTTRIEMPRIKDQLPRVFKGIRGVRIRFAEACPKTPASVLVPGAAGYADTLGAIVRPLLGDARANPSRKLVWLAGMTTGLLVEVAHAIEPGMDGAQVRGLLFKRFADEAVESNLFLVALKGQESHFHPLYDERYRVTKNAWIKLVAGARYAEQIVSATVMVKIGGTIPAKLQAAYAALQDGVVAYADLYRNGVAERDIYPEVGKRFRAIEKRYGLKGWAKSAYAHHMGGPTSPLGNRDYILEKDGTRTMFPGMQFAINPVEVLGETKVELQGVVTEDGAPEMLDYSIFTPDSLLTFREVEAEGGTVCKVPNLILRD